ncbi:MAG TPA: N-acetylneuraminate synthase family protein [Bryobacteraceae bacterium]
MEKLNIAGRLVGPGEPPFIVAEIGSNHNGDLSLCRRLIEEAKHCGADAVKFQSWTKRSLVSKAEYERNTRYGTKAGSSTLEEELERYQLTPEAHGRIAADCQEVGIPFFSSCFSFEEVDLLESLNVPAYKIASMDVNHLPLLEYVAKKGKPILLSTGLATLGEIEAALAMLGISGAPPVALLHCLSIYPSPAAIVNLRNMATLQTAFDVPVGYSDHSLGTSIPIAAVALGACIIEKHFTLDKQMDGWDHAISADPAELSYLVSESKNVFSALGKATRGLTSEQLHKRTVFRRRVVLARPLKAGEKITAADLDYKRPGNGINPDEIRYVVGRAVKRDVESEEELEWSDI